VVGPLRLALACAALVSLPQVAAAQDAPLGGIGTQARLTSQGPDGDPMFDASAPDIAYNSRRDEFFVVWHGDSAEASGRFEVYGQRLTGQGAPIGGAIRISEPANDRVAVDPAIAYDSKLDRYAVVFTAGERSGIYGGWIQLQMLDASGRPSGEAVPFGRTGVRRWRAWEADIVYNPLDQRYLVVWGGTPSNFPAVPPIPAGQLIDASTGEPLGEIVPANSSEPADSALPDRAPRQLSAVRRPDNRYVVAWVNAVGDAEGSIHRSVLEDRQGTLVPLPTPEQPVWVAGRYPMLAATPDGLEVALVYSSSAEEYVEGEEVYLRRLDASGHLGVASRLSAAGRRGSGDRFSAERPAIAHHPGRDVFLVAWTGTDDDRPGIRSTEREIAAQAVTPAGREIGRDDFLVSRMGFRDANEAGPDRSRLALAANPRTGELIVVWSADDARPPLAYGEEELWGRRVGPTAVHDEDQDGVPAGSDCDDTNPDIRPGAREIAGNDIDEDCSAKTIDRKRTRARVHSAWLFGSVTTNAWLRVEGAKPGMTVRVSCSGAGCPRPSGGRVVRIRRRGTVRLTHLLAGARLRAGAVVTVRVSEPGAIGVLERFRMRTGKSPLRQTRCLIPGRKRAVRCPA
jgi:hypothetical protein